MRTVIIDRCLLGAALVAALASATWFGREALRSNRHRPDSARETKSTALYRSVAIERMPEKTREWLPPPAQTRGPGWVYEVFTTPEIRYDKDTQQFAVLSPDETGGSNARAASPEVVLVAVKRQPFRLQLVGYVGGEGKYLGTFENVATSEVFLGGAGRRIPALDLVIAEFNVRRDSFPLSDGVAGNHWVATAVVHDARTGEATTLTAGERTYTDELRAVLADDPDEAESYVEFRHGDEFARAGRSYKVERLQLEPPVAELIEASAVTALPVRWSLSADADGSSPESIVGQPAPPHDH